VSFTPHVPINDRDNPSICVLIESDLVGRTAPLSNSERNTGGLFGHGCGEPGRLTTFGCFYNNWISTLGHNRHAAPHRPSWRVQGQLFAMQESWPEISFGHNLYRWHSNKRQAPGECPSKRIEPPLVENAVARRHLRLAMFLVATNGARPMWPAGESERGGRRHHQGREHGGTRSHTFFHAPGFHRRPFYRRPSASPSIGVPAYQTDPWSASSRAIASGGRVAW
jgi:hypothetical protein